MLGATGRQRKATGMPIRSRHVMLNPSPILDPQTVEFDSNSEDLTSEDIGPTATVTSNSGHLDNTLGSPIIAGRPQGNEKSTEFPSFTVNDFASPLLTHQVSTSSDRKRVASPQERLPMLKLDSSGNDDDGEVRYKPHEQNRSLPSPPRVQSPRKFALSEEVIKDIELLGYNEFMTAQLMKRGWLLDRGVHQGSPTSNPFYLHAMCCEDNPWRSRSLHLLNPTQLSACLENVYADQHSIYHALQFVPRKDDVVVTGVYRSGQTPVLHALTCLREGRIVPKHEIRHHVTWLEGKHSEKIPSFQRHDAGGRLIKTHMPLRTVFGGIVRPCPKGTLPLFRVVVVLRDPVDIRLSWFRHVRRVYRKCNPTENFDAHVNVDDFAGVQLYAVNPNVSSVIVNQSDYENYVAEVCKSTFVPPPGEEATSTTSQNLSNGQILVIYYEELLINPLECVQRLAEFSGYGASLDPEFLTKVATMLTEDDDYPIPLAQSSSPRSFSSETAEEMNRHKRIGCSGHGRSAYSKDSNWKFESKWRDVVSHLGVSTSGIGISLASYDRLVVTTSPIIKRIVLSNMQMKSSSSSPMKKMGSFTLLPRPRLSSLSSLFRSSSSKKSSNNKPPITHLDDDPMEVSESSEGADYLDSEAEEIGVLEVTQLAALFPSSRTTLWNSSTPVHGDQHAKQHQGQPHDQSISPSHGTTAGMISFATGHFAAEKSRTRTRTSSSLLGFLLPSPTSASDQPTVQQHHLAGTKPPSSLPRVHLTVVDPDDSDIEELNMFATHRPQRRTGHQGQSLSNTATSFLPHPPPYPYSSSSTTFLSKKT